MGAVARDALEAVLLAVVLFAVLQVGLQNTIVDGPSMEPNCVDQQWLLVNKLAYRWTAPQRGDVIVFRAPDGSGKEFIKRVIALPGESVALRHGVVFIDGAELGETWSPRRDDCAFGPYVVPAGQLFVLGDNRANSNDSRTWVTDGSGLDRSRIIGRAWLSIWPADRWGRVAHAGPEPTASAVAVP